jgi:hypothetical protein
MKFLKLTGLVAALGCAFCVSSNAALYSFGGTDILPGETPSPLDGIVTGVPGPIGSVVLALTFASADRLTGGANGMQGLLYLGNGQNPPYVSITPTYSGSGPFTWSASFGSSSPFFYQSANDTWHLSLWANDSSPLGNTLNGWSLAIDAVPEPVTMALGAFGLIAGGAGLISWVRRHSGKRRRAFLPGSADFKSAVSPN